MRERLMHLRQKTKGSWIFDSYYVDDLLIRAESEKVMEDVVAQR